MTRASWEAVSGTHIGSVHVRDGQPLQDSVRTWAQDGTAVAAVADGHGHRDHFRSDIGAQLATQAATDALVAALPGFTDSAAAHRALPDVAARLLEDWLRRVGEHTAAHPFQVDQPDPLRPYGTTLLAMAVTGDVLAMLQIGDGDTVVVSGDGHAARPLPEDPFLDGVRTASLCQPDPLSALRVAAIDVRTDDVVLAFQCTDGFGASRVDAQGWWQQTGEELVRFTRDRGLPWVAEQLPVWLEEPARVGGDDTTLALLART